MIEMTKAKIDVAKVDWDKGNGLLPAIIQDAGDGAVLMLGYMNREALAEIPFLTPPADFWAAAKHDGTVSPETVDAIVRTVLEKIESQLHELLSQDVLKPLVENLLQNELGKRTKR